ncbi:MAG TPA: tRNA glutamyl-Q(34) synthetase GluQRS [Acetobacteraceae bacterium]
MSMVTRFAPSPTGFLHLGHAYAALLAWRRAREAGGRFLLRIEDIDAARCRPAYTAAILEDLDWLGLDWDEVRIQSEHLFEYRTTLDRLVARSLLYPCFCTRAEIAQEIARSSEAPHAPDGSRRYPGTCRHLPADQRAARIAAGAPYALRLDLARAVASLPGPLTYDEEGEGTVVCHPERFGDPVLARKDIPASYQLCVTHDDALQGVTLVTRAADLKASTDLQRLLQALMDWPAPRYAHHRVLTDATGRRLSKRDGAIALRSLRTEGHTPARVRKMAGDPAA